MSLLQRYLKADISEAKRDELIAELKATRAEMLKIPFGLGMDEKYKRMKYVRYADDFLIGVIGRQSRMRTYQSRHYRVYGIKT